MKSFPFALVFFILVTAKLFSQSLGIGEAGFSDQQPVKMDKPIRFSKYKDGAFLFVDFNNYAIRQVDHNGEVTSLFGGPDKKGFQDGDLNKALFDGIHGVAYDEKNDIIYIASASNNVVRKIIKENDGFQVETISGTPKVNGFADGDADQAKFNSLHEILYGKNGEIYVLDIGNAKIRKLKNGKVSSLVGKDSLAPIIVNWKYPIDMAFDGDDIVICDAGNSSIYRFTPGKEIKKLELDNPIKMPHGITSDGNGNLYVADMGANAIYKIENDTRVTLVEPTAENGFDNLNKPADVIIINGTLWVADLNNHQLKQQKL
jgi:DNA-binding beta-propeller fold protein YncE